MTNPTSPSTTPRQNEFFKFYIYYMIAVAVLDAVPMLLWGFTDNDPAVNSSLTIGLNIVGSLLNLAAFVLSIVALVLFIKRKYPKVTWLLPIGYFALLGTSLIFSAVYSLTTLGQQVQRFEDLGPNPDPADIQAMAESIGSDIPLAIVVMTLVQSAALLTLALVTWFKTKHNHS